MSVPETNQMLHIELPYGTLHAKLQVHGNARSDLRFHAYKYLFDENIALGPKLGLAYIFTAHRRALLVGQICTPKPVSGEG
jgi:hypothetical protein